GARVCGRGRLVEDLPVAGLEVAVVPVGQLLGDIAQRVHSAALLERRRPQLARRLPQAGGAVGDHQRRRAHAAGEQVAAEVEPVLVALLLPNWRPSSTLLPSSVTPQAPARPRLACLWAAASGTRRRG